MTASQMKKEGSSAKKPGDERKLDKFFCFIGKTQIMPRVNSGRPPAIPRKTPIQENQNSIFNLKKSSQARGLLDCTPFD